jgi:hypothetical protein
MLDPEFDVQPTGRDKQTSRSRKVYLLALAIVALLASNALWMPIYSRRPSTCVVCRADKVVHHFLWLKWSIQQETDCSRWYDENVEPSHSHSWIPCTYCQRFGIPGLGGGYSCSIGGPLTGLSRTVQVSIYQHFKDRLEAKRLFLRLGETDAESSRMWSALLDWVNQDYPGTWAEWYKQRPLGSR